MARYTSVGQWAGELEAYCESEREKDQYDVYDLACEQSCPPMQVPRGWGYNLDGSVFRVKHQEVIEMLEGKEL